MARSTHLFEGVVQIHTLSDAHFQIALRDSAVEGDCASKPIYFNASQENIKKQIYHFKQPTGPRISLADDAPSQETDIGRGVTG